VNVRVFGIPLAIDESVVGTSVAEIRQRVVAYERARGHERGKRGDRDDQDDWSGFDVEVDYPAGFTGSVMREMAKIPCGETRTYGEIAAALDTASVAVGGACGRNPVPLIVPCHRVVGADSIGGYSGGGDRGPELKRRLLEHERTLAGTAGNERLGGTGDRNRTLEEFSGNDRSPQNSIVDS
jgi:methylated-DNA-[protein]-cysteine S-methyltransferase